jgi:NADH-quinone oxidoreductase subunit J
MFVMIAALKTDVTEQVKSIGAGNIGLVSNLGMALFKDYVVPFELSSILFLSAMVGAVVIGKKE